jgi:hypothetical protein
MSNANQVLITSTLQRKLRKELVTDSITNRDFEGEISGPEDSVKVLVAQAANVQDYTGGKISPQTNLDATSPQLDLDHKKAFNFLLSGDTNLTRYVNSFSNETFAEVLEQAQGYVLSKADPALTGEMTAGDLTYDSTTDDIAELLSNANTALSENGVPVQGRFVVLPSAVAADAYDVVANRDTARGDVADEMGMIGMFRGLRIYEAASDLFPTTSSNPVAHFGHFGYHTYADAVVSVQVIDQVPDAPAAIQVQGLHVAGSKITQPDAFGRIEITG